MPGSGFNPWKNVDNCYSSMSDGMSGEPPQWPIKLWKAPIVSPYYHRAHLLIASDCSAFFSPAFYSACAGGKVPLICCMDTDFDVMTKLSKIFMYNDIHSVTVLKLDRECCRDLTISVIQAIRSSRLPIPMQVSTIFVEAETVD